MEDTSVATEKEEKNRSKKLFSNGANCFKICNRFKFKKSKFFSNSKPEEPISNHLHSRVAAFGDCVNVRNSIFGSSNESLHYIDRCCFLVTVLGSLKSSLSRKSRKDCSEADDQSPDCDEIITNLAGKPAANNGKSSFEISNAREETAVKVQDQVTTADVVDVENGEMRQQSATARSLSSSKDSMCFANTIFRPVKLAASSESQTNDSIGNGRNRNDKEQLPLKGEVYFFSDSNIGTEKFDRKGRRNNGNNNGNKKLFRKLEVNNSNKNVNKNKSSELFGKSWTREINNDSGSKQSTLNGRINRLPTKRPKRMPNSNDRTISQQSRKTAAAAIVFGTDGYSCVEKGNCTTVNCEEAATKDVANPTETRPIVTNKDEGLQSDRIADADCDSERRRSTSDKINACHRGAPIVSRIPIWKRRCPMHYCNKPEMKSTEVQTSTIVGMYQWNAENIEEHRRPVLNEPQQAEHVPPSSDTVAKSNSDRPVQNSITYTELPPVINWRSYSCTDENSTASLQSSLFGRKSPIIDGGRSTKPACHDLGDINTDGKDERSWLDNSNGNTDDQAIFDKYESLQILNEDFLKDNVDKDDFLATTLAKVAPTTASDPLLLASYRCNNKQMIEDISTVFGEFQELGLQEKIRLLEELVNKALEEIPESVGNEPRETVEEKDEMPERAVLSDRQYAERENGCQSKPGQCQLTASKTFFKPCRAASSRIPRLRYHSIVPVERAPNGKMFQTDNRKKLKATAKLSISIPSLSSSSADFHIHSVISEITVNSNTNTPLKYLTSYANVPDTLTDVASLKSEIPFAFDPVSSSECCDRNDGTSGIIDKKTDEEEETEAGPILSELQQVTLDETDRTRQTDRNDDNLAASLDHISSKVDDSSIGKRSEIEIDFV